MKRWLYFLLSILAGAGLGLVYGWVISPVEYVDTTPNSLSEDYRTDYVLMTAEAYAADGDIALASRRLAALGNQPAVEQVNTALLFAQRVGYSDADLALMRTLFNDLLNAGPPGSSTQQAAP
jgi:hypothetical protein